jgi:hypothetical protein
MTAERGDACQPSDELLAQHFDVAFSNSVIEHVGGHFRREQFAEAVRQLAPRHWVQAPYRYFPIEPHWLFPAFSLLPVRGRLFVAQHWRLGAMPPEDRREAVGSVLGTEFLSRTEMGYYFPGSSILTERVAGLPKSLVAVLS